MTRISDPLVQRYRRARRDPTLTVLDGFHALKHALIFRAEILEVALGDEAGLERMAAGLPGELTRDLPPLIRPMEPQHLALLAPQGPRAGVMAIARRPRVDLARAFADPRPAPAILLEEPAHMGNLGACVRAAAAAGVAAVITTGHNDPWHPDAIRGAAALHYALPVARITELPPLDRPLVAVEVGGEPLGVQELPARALLAFGTERHGLSDGLLERAEARVGIPMRPGVASLNLATAVAVVLYTMRPAASSAGPRTPDLAGPQRES
jgi:RNA methyltransferase, TrmH family